VKGLLTGKTGKVFRGGCLTDFLQPPLKPYSLLRVFAVFVVNKALALARPGERAFHHEDHEDHEGF